MEAELWGLHYQFLFLIWELLLPPLGSHLPQPEYLPGNWSIQCVPVLTV